MILGLGSTAGSDHDAIAVTVALAGNGTTHVDAGPGNGPGPPLTVRVNGTEVSTAVQVGGDGARVNLWNPLESYGDLW